jgi:hypothetical protein
MNTALQDDDFVGLFCFFWGDEGYLKECAQLFNFFAWVFKKSIEIAHFDANSKDELSSNITNREFPSVLLED